MFLLAVVVAKRLFVEVTEEMEGLDTNIGSLQSALEEAPEVFESIGVNPAIDVLFGVIGYLVDKIAIQSLIGHERIGIDRAASGDMVLDFFLNRFLAAIRNYRSANLSATLQDSHDWSFVFGASFGNADSPFLRVHEASRTTDKSFVYLDLTANHSERFILQGEPDAVKHEPCRLLSDAECAGHFVRANAVLAVGEHPSCYQPLVEADGGILKNGSHFDGELTLGVMAGTLPDAARNTKRNALGAASRADNAFGPATRRKVIEAVIRIREVKDRFLQALWFAHGLVLHELKVPYSSG